jgi:alpha-N-arabinofuranosidase
MLTGTEVTLDQADSPTFIGIRQKDFNASVDCNVALTQSGEAGITMYMDENHHYDFAIRHADDQYEIILRLNIGDIKHVQQTVPIGTNSQVQLLVEASHERYTFSFQLDDGQSLELGTAQTKYLSSEVAGGFTGVIIGLYAVHEGVEAQFSNFVCEYQLFPNEAVSTVFARYEHVPIYTRKDLRFHCRVEG